MKNTKSTNTCPNCKKELGIGSTTVNAIEKDGHFYCKNCGAELGSTLDHPNAIAALEKPTDAYQASYNDISLPKLWKEVKMKTLLNNIKERIDLNPRPGGRPETVTVDSTPTWKNVVIEVKKLKAKLEQMLLDQKLPAGSADVEIDDLTAAHNETNVKLARLGKLEEIESSAEKAEKDLSSAEEELTERENAKNVLEDDLQEEEEELEELDQFVVKQLKNRYNDPTIFKRFVIGVDRSRMKLYDVEQEAQEELVDGELLIDDSIPVADRTTPSDKFNDFKV